VKKNGPKEYVLIIRFSGETNGKLERFYGVYDQKRHQFKSIDEYVHWHNEIKPHMSLNGLEAEIVDLDEPTSTERICPECGAAIPQDSRFCDQCGVWLVCQ